MGSLVSKPKAPQPVSPHYNNQPEYRRKAYIQPKKKGMEERWILILWVLVLLGCAALANLLHYISTI